MNELVHKDIKGSSAVEIAESIETAIESGRLAPGDRLPTVRGLADALELSPSTVSAAYAALRTRGMLVARGRRGTAVSPRPPLAIRSHSAPLPEGVRDLASGNPDPRLLPRFGPLLAGWDPEPILYAASPNHEKLVALARETLCADGIPADGVAIVGGALDAIERVLQARLRAGDRIGIEDPGFMGVLDLVAALGLDPVPIAVDDEGPLPDSVRAALQAGIRALIVTPRAQNPTGAALSAQRVRELRRVLRDEPSVLIVEDDHAGEISGAPARTLCAGREVWAVTRSFSKPYGPDLRLAFLAGDVETLARVEGRQLIGMRWISHVLQHLAWRLARSRKVQRGLRRAEREYARRREALIGALAEHDISARGKSGLNVWVSVPDEGRAVSGLLQRGWGVAPGQRFRNAPGAPGVRVTVAALTVEEARELARDLAETLVMRRGRSASV